MSKPSDDPGATAPDLTEQARRLNERSGATGPIPAGVLAQVAAVVSRCAGKAVDR